MKKLFKILILTGFFEFLAKQLFACSVCFGDPQSLQMQGLNWAIVVLLIILSGIFIIFIKFIIAFKKRAKLLSEPE